MGPYAGGRWGILLCLKYLYALPFAGMNLDNVEHVRNVVCMLKTRQLRANQGSPWELSLQARRALSVPATDEVMGSVRTIWGGT